MLFRYQTAAIQYHKDTKEYVHPITEKRVQDVLQCLAGWKEPDPVKRRNWGMLVKNIREFWEDQDNASQSDEVEEIVFS
ncbi:MAG: hypothetical protein V1753_04585 [Pseudomonadota bacterium]